MSFDQHNKTKSWLKHNAMDLYLKSETRKKENPMIEDPDLPPTPMFEMTVQEAEETVRRCRHLQTFIDDERLHSDQDRVIYQYLKALWFLKGLQFQKNLQ